jgi:sigma-E factor negative regulatory protein RseB
MSRSMLAAGALLTMTLTGSAAADVGPAQESDQRALDLLVEASDAARSTDFQGTQVVMLWMGDRQYSASVQVAHRAGVGSRIDVERTANTPARSLFERDDAVSSSVALTATALGLVRRNYVVRLDGSEDVMGRMVDIVLVRTRSGVPVQRLWIDRRTRLAIRRAFYDHSGMLMRQTAFVTLSERTPEIDAPAQVATIPVSSHSVSADMTGLRNAGWKTPAAVPDGMVTIDSSVTGTGDDAVLRMSFTDGIATMSLFEQRGALDASGLSGWRRDKIAGVPVWISNGYPRRVVWSGGDRVYTVVTECEERSVEQMVRSLPRGDSSYGFARRVARGAQRVGSWVNPAR